MNRWSLLYDASCALCRRQVALVRRFDWRGHIALLDSNSNIARAQFPTLSPQATRHEIHLAAPNGHLFRGADAVRRTLLLIPALTLFGALCYLPGVMALARPLYAWVARNRYRFGKAAACEDGSCLLDTERTGPHPE